MHNVTRRVVLLLAVLAGMALADQAMASIFKRMVGGHPDGVITEEGLRAQQERWHSEMDADGDGVVTYEEMALHRFVEMDADGNGVITLEEWGLFFVGEEHIEAFMAAETGEHPDSMFSVETMDADGDGVVTIEEFILVVRARFEHKDRDGDGSITPDEYSGFRQRLLDAQDADGRGYLSLDDLP